MTEHYDLVPEGQGLYEWDGVPHEAGRYETRPGTTPVFLHVPRTGGTSFRLLAEKWWDKRDMLTIYGKDILRATKILERVHKAEKPYQLIRGHFTSACLQVLGTQNFWYMAFLRNPVERVASLYRYIRRDPAHFLHKATKAISLEEFVRSGVSLETNDGMVRQLCGTEPELPQREYNRSVHRHTPLGEMTRNNLVDAMAQLLQFTLVGTAERMDESYALLTQRVSPSLRCRLGNVVAPHANTTAREGITGSARKAIGELNALDFELWQWATQELEEDLQWIEV